MSETKRIAHVPSELHFDKVNVFEPSNLSNKKTTGHQTIKKQIKKKTKRPEDDFINDDDPYEDNRNVAKHSRTNSSNGEALSGSITNETRFVNKAQEKEVKLNFYNEALSGSFTNERQFLTKDKGKQLELEFKRKFNDYTGRLREKDGTIVMNPKLMADLQIRNAYKQQQQQQQQTKSKGRRRNKPVPLESWDVQPMDTQSYMPVSKLRDISGRNLDWDEYLNIKGENIITNLSRIPPVHYFKNAPLANIWETFAKPGLLIELRNPYVADPNAYWIAKIIYFAGYRALVRFVDFEDEQESSGYLEWISFCSAVPKPLGWVENKAKTSLNPGPIISGMSKDTLQQNLKEFYTKHQQKNTISHNHRSSIIQHIQKMQKIDYTATVECLDLVKFNETRLAKVTTVLGNRCHVSYNDDNGVRNYPIGYKQGFCYSFHSESIHPFGWSHTIGVKLNGNPKNLLCSPLAAECFPSWPSDKIYIQVGMRLETRHPFATHKLVGAIITKVFKYGYFQIETRDEKDTFRSPYIYHITSRFIFPVGFAEKHGITAEYVEPTRQKNLEERPKLRLDLLPPHPPHKFAVGMKVEAIDIRDSRFVLAATIKEVAGHMMRIYFDNWDPNNVENYSWVDSESSDVFPLGYSEMTAIDWQGTVDES